MPLFSRMASVAHALPEKQITNENLTKIVDTTPAWILERTGIASRYLASESETAVDLGFKAAQKAIYAAGLTPSDIDLVIVATATPDQMMPNTALAIADRLGLQNKPGYDISVACSGFIYALSQADLNIVHGQAKRVLVIGVEIMSRLIDWSDRTTCVLFGDGAGACVLVQDTEPGVFHHQISGQPSLSPMLYTTQDQATLGIPATFHMHGREVFKHAVRTMKEVLVDMLEQHDLTVDQLDWLVPHQANLRIIQSLSTALHVSSDKIAQSLKKHGNTSAASIPLALSDLVESGKLRSGDQVAMVAWGAGVSFGGALMRFG